jgi:WD40 repeat protein
MARNTAGRSRSPVLRGIRSECSSPDFPEQDRDVGPDLGRNASNERAANFLYDVFISYAEADRAWVEGFLIDSLESAGVRCHREAAFTLGVPRLAEFEKAVRSSARILLVLSPAYFSSETASFVDLLAQTYGLETSTWPVIPLRLAPVDLPTRLAMLTALDAIDPDEREEVLDKLADLFQRPIRAAPSRPDCPYPGMRAFTLDDEFPFFGRDHESEELLQHLRQSRFLAVIGASGSGKSSLVFAGLVARLRKTSLFGPGQWLVRSMRPGERPLAELTRVLGTDPADPAAAVAHALEVDSDAERLLLVVDQFEEVFAPGQEKSEPLCLALRGLLDVERVAVVLTVRADFYAELMGTSLWPQIKANRVDVGPLDEAGLREVIYRPAETAGVYVESALVERLVSDAVEARSPGILPLVQEVLVQLWERLERRVLPLHAYESLVLARTSYDRHHDGQQRTGLEVAIARHADGVLKRLEVEDPGQVEIARRIFLRLVQFGDGRPDTRRQQAVAQLRAGNDPVRFEAVLNALAGNRLITLVADCETCRRRADIAHEALIHGWPQLQRWIEEWRKAEEIRRKLEQKAQEWIDSGTGTEGLLGTGGLAIAEMWVTSPDGRELPEDDPIHRLIRESRAHIQRAEIEREAAGQRELEAARRLAAEAEARRLAEVERAREAERRAREQAEAARRQSRLAGTLKVVAAVAIAFAAAAFYSQNRAIRATSDATRQKNKAEENEKIAQAETKVARHEANRTQNLLVLARSNRLLDHKPQLALLLALESLRVMRDIGEYDLNPANQSGREVLNVTFSNLSGIGLYGHAGPVNHLAYAPDGRTLATASSDGTVRLWDVAAVHVTQPRVLRHDGPARRLIFAPDGRTLVVAFASDEGEVWLWDLAAPDPAARPRILRCAERVEELAIAPDGRTLATGHGDGTVRLWDPTAPDPARPCVLEGSEGSIIQVAFAPKKRILAALSAAGVARLWDLTTSNSAAEPRVLRHDGRIRYITFAPDGRTLASATDGGVVRLWDLASTDPAAGPTLLRHNRGLLHVAFTPDGRTLASATDGGVVWLWDVASSDPAAGPKLLHHRWPVVKVAFAPDGRTLATASGGALWLWDLATAGLDPHPRHYLKGHDDTILQVEFGPDGKTLASTSSDGTARLWDLAAPSPITNPQIFHHEYNVDVYRVALTPDGKTLASASADGTVRLWDLTAPDPAAHPHILPHGQPIDLLAIAPDGRTLASALFNSGDGTVRLWDLTAPDPAARPRILHHERPVLQVAFTPDNRTLATATIDGTVRLSDLTAPDPAARPRIIQHHGLAWFTIAPDGHMLATGSREGVDRVRLWDLTAPDPVRAARVLRDDAPTHYLAFAPEGNTLAAACGDGTVRLWDLTASDSATHPHILKGHCGEFPWVAFAPDGKTLASGALKSGDGTFRLWDLTAPDPAASPRVIKGHKKTLHNVIFAPDGKRLATASIDGTVRVWDPTAADPAAGARLFSRDASVYDVVFSPDGQTLVTARGDGTVRLWMLDHDKLMLQARSKLGRNLTPNEWTQYFSADEPYHRTFPDLPVVGEGAAPAEGEAGHRSSQLSSTPKPVGVH